MFSCDNTAFITVPSKKKQNILFYADSASLEKKLYNNFLLVIRTEDFCITSHPPVLTPLPPTPCPRPYSY